MSHSPVQKSSLEMLKDPSGIQPPSLKDRIANAVFMVDATIGIGNTIGIVCVLVVAGYLFVPMVVAHFFPPKLSPADQLALQRQLEWPISIDETFDDDQIHTDADWGLGSASNEDFDVYRELADGQYFTWVDFWTSDCCVKSYHLVTPKPLENFIVSADFTKQEGGKPPSYGVVFHYRDADNFYILTYNDVGNLTLETWYQGDREVILSISDLDRIIQPFEANRLVLSVADGHGLILINDQYIGQFDDNRIPRGRLGFAVGAPFDGYTAAISIDNVELHTPD